MTPIPRWVTIRPYASHPTRDEVGHTPAPEWITKRAPLKPGQVADDLLGWIDEDACDGFNFNIDRYIDGLEHLVDWLVPELQRRGRFRKEYESTTFRGNLGIT